MNQKVILSQTKDFKIVVLMIQMIQMMIQKKIIYNNKEC